MRKSPDRSKDMSRIAACVAKDAQGPGGPVTTTDTGCGSRAAFRRQEQDPFVNTGLPSASHSFQWLEVVDALEPI